MLIISIENSAFYVIQVLVDKCCHMLEKSNIEINDIEPEWTKHKSIVDSRYNIE